MSAMPLRIGTTVQSPVAVPSRTLTLVPKASPEPLPTTPPSFGPFFRWLGGIGFFLSALWEGREVYTALREVPNQVQWLPGAPIDPAIWADPLLTAETARQRFGQMSDPALRQLYEVRKRQAVPQNPLADPTERRLMVPGTDGEWVQVPLDGQSTGALLLMDFWATGDGRPVRGRAEDERRLIEIELDRRRQPASPFAPSNDPWKEAVSHYLEALRRRGNGEDVALPELFSIPSNTRIGSQPMNRIILNSADKGQRTNNLSSSGAQLNGSAEAAMNQGATVEGSGREAGVNATPTVSGSDSDHSYIIQGGQQGSDRLVILANATWPTSKIFLQRAGLKAGMSCLDVGCGNGEISLRLFEILGPTGIVHGVDMDATKIAIAKEKAVGG